MSEGHDAEPKIAEARYHAASGRVFLELSNGAMIIFPVALVPLLADADVVSLHKALTRDTRGFFDRARLFRMKPGAVLINTARGALIDSDALVEAVASGHLRGAAIDVFDIEPLPAGHPFTTTDGILLSPHIGGGWGSILFLRALAQRPAGSLPPFCQRLTHWSSWPFCRSSRRRRAAAYSEAMRP